MGVLPRSTASALVMLMLSSILAGCLLGGVADGGPDADDLDIGIDVLSGGVFQGVSLKAGADLSVYIPYLVLDPMTGFVQNSTIIDIRRGESVQISILPPPRNDEAFLLIAEHGRKLWPVRDSNESWSTWASRGGQRDSENSITKVAGESEGMLSTVNASSDAAAVVNYARIPVVRGMAGAFSEDEGGLYSTGVVNGREVYDTLAKITDTDPSLTDIYDGAQGYLDRWAGQGNSAYEDAAQFLIAELSSYGLEVISHRFEFTDIFGMQNPEAYNICGYRYGELYPDEWLVFGAHFDMAPPANAVLLDPHDTGSRTYGTRVGAYDNTAGTSMVLTAAKSMSEFKSRRTMVYCLWSGEEGGKRGSDYWTEYYVKGDNPEVTVTNYINLDMGGVNWPGGGVQGWISNPSNDIDGDGCSDQDEDLDDDGDGVGDSDDSCPAGESGWISNSATDHDGDGCRDGIEDDDSDDDGLIDMIDQCPFGDLQWSSDNGTDWDGDGCRDAGEDTDDDADGVVDGNDACPFTTDAASADADGCDDLQRDSDDDGVLDMDDTCPGTPLGLEVSSNGCGDRDGDGIPFDEDLCPTTPAEFLDEVNEFGCADIDGDGVSEDIDDCPASPPRWTIDTAGCAVVQLPIPWNVGPYATTPTSFAGGFSVTTFSGTWTLQNEWSGHETYLFFARYAASSYNTDLWSQDVGDLISSLPQQNSHFFFASFDSSYHNDMLTMQQRVENHITTLSSAEEAHWREHIHYIDQNFWDVSGSLGDVRDDWQSFYYGIDRFQRWREVGSLYSWGTSSNTYQLKSLANEALMYDSEFRAEIRKDDPGITVVTVFDDQWHSGGWSGGYSSYSNASLPNSSVMAEFNTLEIYLYHACDEHKNRYDSDGDGQSDAGCHEWDYMEYVRLCEEVGNHSTCGTEFARYITTYGREGRWLTDISSFLFMLKEGGTREFKLETANGGGITAILLLSTWGDDGLRPDSAEYLFDGGQFRGDYNNESIYKRHHELTIPQDTVKVELVALITGHGFGNDDANCAEFCNHEHRFTLNGLSTQEDHPMAGNSSVSSDNKGCEKLTAEGVTANQLGSWPFGRAGWCPGLDVEQWTFDITNWIDWTGENNLTYAGLFDGQNYIPQNEGGGSTQTIRVTSWVVYYVNSSGGVGITAQTPEDSQADSTALAEGEPTADGQQQIQLTTRRPRIADVGIEDNR